MGSDASKGYKEFIAAHEAATGRRSFEDLLDEPTMISHSLSLWESRRCDEHTINQLVRLLRFGTQSEKASPR